MSDNRNWGTTKNFQLPYPTSDTPIYSTPVLLRELAEAIDSALHDFDQRITALENRKDGIVDPKGVAKAIGEAVGLPAITVKVDHQGQVTVKAPGLDEKEALLITLEAIRAFRETANVKRRLQGE